MNMRRGVAAFLVVAALGGLAGCESAKDKAARHLQSALELVEKGDGDRAVVEFRNVFKLEPGNRTGRMAFAKLLIGRGDMSGAYGQYQHVIDATPADQEALRAAAGLAATAGNWANAGKHADALLALVPQDPAMLAIKSAVDYAQAFATADAKGRADAAGRAADLLASDLLASDLLAGQPQNLLLHRVIIDNLVQNADYTGALAALDKALALFPKERELYQVRVSILATLGDNAGVEAGLKAMAALFPDDMSASDALLRWYIAHDQIDQAEAWLRVAAAGKDGNPDLTAEISLIAFLQKYRSPEQALSEVDTLLAGLPPAPVQTGAADNTQTGDQTGDQTAADPAGTDAAVEVTPDTLRTLRASILFDQGNQDAAIKAMQDILTTAQPSDQSRRIKVTLARMLVVMGDPVQARALIEQVLAEDAGQTEALKLKAAWLTDEDKTDDAVALLRTALDANPRDAETMTLLANAYGRTGSHDLQGDMLGQAVAASGKAPLETLRYAQFLMADEKYLPTETLLVDALRLDPANIGLLDTLGRLYVAMKDWPRATGIVDRLTEIATPEAIASGNMLRPVILANQDNVAAAIDYLKGVVDTSGNNLGAQAALLRAYLANGQQDEAKALATVMLANAPQDPATRYAVATVKGATGDNAGALADYRALVTEDPSRQDVWMALVRQTARNGDVKAAEAVLDEGLTHLPLSGDLLLMKANFMEQRQDIDGAIAVYDKLYTDNSANLIVANNLASLLASYRTDKPSLDRAWAIARRLNGTQEPAFADTFGWIAQTRGNTGDAIPYLELAAKSLVTDPMVQFHLAEAYKAAGRASDAKAQYAKVLALVPTDDSRPFVILSRTEAAK